MNIDELYNLLLSNNPSTIIKEKEDKIFELIPELKICKGFNQNSSWHIYDVYEHILHVIDNVPNILELRLAALFHDIGKPLTYTEDEEHNGHFYNHWQVSREIFLSFAKKHNLDNELTDTVANLIYYHDLKLSKIDTSIINILRKDNLELLFLLKRADLLAQNKKYHYLIEDYSIEEQRIKRLVK